MRVSVHACVWTKMKEEIYEHTDKKAPEAKVVSLHLTHSLILCFMLIASPIMPIFRNAHSQHKIFEMPTNGKGFPLYFFFNVHQAGRVTSLIDSSTIDAAEKGNLQGGPDFRVQIEKKKKKIGTH